MLLWSTSQCQPGPRRLRDRGEAHLHGWGRERAAPNSQSRL